MIKLAEHDSCTGCGACAFRCPKKCISMHENNIGIILPIIDETICVECHSCEDVCPIINEPQSNKSICAYAAWSNDSEERRTSASGGIAIEAYKYALEKGYKVVGASQNEDFTVSHKMAEKKEHLTPFKNSKYVFSSAYDVFPKIRHELKNKQKILFIGLPCQVAALRKLFRDDKNLLLIEVVCHGTTPHIYLKQHIEMISNRTGKIVSKMSFRDPYAHTCNFTFTLYDENGKLFYAKRTKEGDTYQFGYHRAVTYRENCYNCPFAKPERNADITIADYHGLGIIAPSSFSDRDVSLILENTSKGRDFVNELKKNNRIYAEKRPLEEPFMGEAQLRHPSVKSKYRIMFEEKIKANNGCFEEAIIEPMRKYNKDIMLKSIVSLPYRVARKIYRLIIKRI